MDELAEFLRNVDEARDASGLAESVFSNQISGSPDAIRKARTRQALPKEPRLGMIARNLGLTVDQLLGRTEAPVAPPRLVEIVAAGSVGDVSRTFRQAPQDLPVRGTALGHNMNFDTNGQADVEVTLFDPGEPLHYVTRPPALFNNDSAYAIYVQGDSMFPAHKDGALRVVNPRVGVRVGDDVVVQLHASDGDDGQAIVSALIKTLVRRSADYVVLRQLNPEREFKVPSRDIASIHRVMDLADLLG